MENVEMKSKDLKQSEINKKETSEEEIFRLAEDLNIKFISNVEEEETGSDMFERPTTRNMQNREYNLAIERTLRKVLESGLLMGF